MTSNIESPLETRVYTTEDGCVAIRQSNDATVLISADQIQAVIQQLHACYDYCAAWKDKMPE